MQLLKVILFCGVAAAAAMPDPYADILDRLAKRDPKGFIEQHKSDCAGKDKGSAACSTTGNQYIIAGYCASHKQLAGKGDCPPMEELKKMFSFE